MGTNYYLRYRSFPCCGYQTEQLHLGKSSAGWCFGLAVDPSSEIKDWDSMQAYLQKTLGEFQSAPKRYPRIENEYNEPVSFQEFKCLVEQRTGRRDSPLNTEWWKPFYTSEEHFYESNHAEPGPNGLIRHKLDGWHCIGHGPGPWDLIIGQFS